MDTNDNNETEARYAMLRERMVGTQIQRRGVEDRSVIDAMRTVPRHLFVPERYLDEAYTDGPVSIGHGQTISQPYIVASMTEYLKPTSGSRVLEIGTGCGYQTAVLAEIVREVYTIEFIPELQERAKKVLGRLMYSNVFFRIGDGHLGWPEAAPFDAIIVTAAADEIPRELEQQLVEGGRMVIPVRKGPYGSQELVLVEKSADGVIRREGLYAVRFVDMQRPEES